jgi:NAD(P)-dependent dehydrogenase (short-subunit alcohol dehydrogenase family)
VTFQPRTAIVTASDSGIGRATAVALAEAGMDVGITWHSDEDGARQTADEVRAHGKKAEVAHLDTSGLGGCGDAADDLIARLGGVDVFVNNADTGASTPMLEMTTEDWRRVVLSRLMA